MRDAHLLARRPEVQAAFEIQPVRARVQESVPPAPPPIEFGDQHEPAVRRSIQVAGEFGDLRFEVRERDGRRR